MRAISAISDNKSDINPYFYEETCDYLFMTYRAKCLVLRPMTATNFL